MIKIYFTALIPASNIAVKYKKIQVGSSLYIPLPAILPLEVSDTPQDKTLFVGKIDNINEFRTGEIVKINNWWTVSILKNDLNTIFTKEKNPYFPWNSFNILLGIDINNSWEPPTFDNEVIRNWELACYELTLGNDDNPFFNIEMKELWKIKKRKQKL